MLFYNNGNGYYNLVLIRNCFWILCVWSVNSKSWSWYLWIYHRENEVEEVKEEGPKEMTLDEWKAIQSKDRAKVEFNIRKPNEGADGQWKKGFVLHKSKSEEVKWFSIFASVQIV